VIHHIHPSKDVDGLTPLNAGKLLIGESDTFIPCTPLGIKVLMERSGIEVAGQHVLIIGRSNLVGKPMAAILMQAAPGGNATVTVANSKTKNLKEISRSADIIIAAMGSPRFITADMVKEGAVVIDVGINKIEAPSRKSGYQLVGDVDFEQVSKKCSFITPVPGGVGPMTIAMLLSNTLKSYMNKKVS
jgi:methylenetetrahydrofolate dehydrogenase (NADP+)/methenyltetrahydrofolate cyclohydrolase